MNFRVLAAAAAIVTLGGGTATAQKIIGPDKPVLAGPGGGPHTAASLSGALASAGRFTTFLAITKVAGWDGDGRAGFCDGSVRGWDGDGKAGFCDGSVRGSAKAGIQDDSVRGLTVLAPNDAAFAAMDKAKLATLMKDKAAARAFLMAHIIPGELAVNDLIVPGNPTSEKHFKSASGGELKLLCNGMPHVGLHHPQINGLAKVAELQDTRFNAGIIQEIDAVLQP